MSKRLVLVLMSVVLLLGLGGSASAVMIDDFEGYADTPALLATWTQVANWGSFGATLDATGGDLGTQGMNLGGTLAGSANGGWAKRPTLPAVDVTGETAFRLWQKTAVGGTTVLDDVVYRFTIKLAGAGEYYYTTESYTSIGGGGNAAGSTALSVVGPWGAGGGGGYIDLPLAGGGDGSGADDWYWKATAGGGPEPPDWSAGVVRVQILAYSYDGSAGDGTFSVVVDNIQTIPEPSSLLLGSFGLALCGGLRRRR